jgi:phospholipase C
MGRERFMNMTESATAGRSRDRIEHVIVLMLENRSFDHLLGYLDHPDPGYPSLDRIKPSCPVRPEKLSGPVVHTSADAHPALGVDPDHSPEAVREQIFGSADAGVRPTMRGFVHSYARQIGGDPPAKTNAVLAALGRAWRRSKTLWLSLFGRPAVPPIGADIMRCFNEDTAPVLSALAKHYAVLVNWFSSVPGETWPNRNFAHAATSHGKTSIALRFYDDTTIFDRLGDDRWRIYHQGVPQVWAFPSTWNTQRRRDNFHDTDRLATDIATGDLPAYTFVEPDHGFGPGDGNSQHPSNDDATGDSFRGGEALIARVYNALAANENLFARTLFLVTYDEHGGFFDHKPPIAVTPPDDDPGEGGFDFRLSGVRVPAVAISPLIPQGHIDTRSFDHSSIPATVRAQFAPHANPLGGREKAATDLLRDLPLLDTPRTDPLTFDRATPRGAAQIAQLPQATQLNDLQASLADLAGAVHSVLVDAPPAMILADDAPPPYRPTPALSAAARTRRLTPDSAADQDMAEVLAQFGAPHET